ncbi:MAG: hypothetical protein ACREQ5_01030 [Candidatus Dormibacteria bacterium]
MNQDRADAMDAAVTQLNEDMTVVEATRNDAQRAQLRAEAEQAYLSAVRGD